MKKIINFVIKLFIVGTISILPQAPIKAGLMLKPEIIWDALHINQEAISKGKPAPYSKKALKNIFYKQIDDLYSQYGASLNAGLSNKPHQNLRIATYNVYSFNDPNNNNSFFDIIDVLGKCNADIIILQEVSAYHIWNKKHELRKSFKKLGYTEATFVAGPASRSDFGNCIISKLKFAKKPYKRNFKTNNRKHNRAFVTVEIDLSAYNKANLCIYGTHLEVSSSNERLLETKELVAMADKYNKGKNVLIAADFNAIRSEKSLRFIEKNKFFNHFSVAKIQEPYFSHWSGKTIDFCYFRKQDLWVAGGFVYYSNASDHMPIVMDIDLSK